MLPTRRRTIRTWSSPLDLWNDEIGQSVSRWCGGDEGMSTGTYPVDIREDESHIFVEAELPGFTKDEVEVTFEKGVLSIRAERKSEEKGKGQIHLAERCYTRVARSFTLRTVIHENKIKARLEDGVLYLALDKREEVKPRRIAVT